MFKTEQADDKLKVALKEALLTDSKELLHMFTTKGRIIYLEEDAVLVKNNDTLFGFYFVLSGFLKSYKMVNEEPKQLVTVFYKGDYIGLNAVLNQVNQQEKIVALNGGATLLFVPSHELLEVLNAKPSLVLPMLKSIEQKILKIEHRAAYLIPKSVDEQLSFLILYLAKLFGVDQNGFIKVVFTPQDMALFVGANRTTIYRGLKKMEREGVIAFKKKRLKICDYKALQQKGVSAFN